MKRIVWTIVKCTSKAEASRIGSALLKARLIPCFDIIPRTKTAYFWPPKERKIETAKGAYLVAETLPPKLKRASKIIHDLHSDTLPFIGILRIEVEEKYYRWVKGELGR